MHIYIWPSTIDVFKQIRHLESIAPFQDDHISVVLEMNGLTFDIIGERIGAPAEDCKRMKELREIYGSKRYQEF